MIIIGGFKYDTPPNAEDAPPLPRASRSTHTSDLSGRVGEHASSRSYPTRRERETSDPLEVSPRDAEKHSDSDMDMAEDWVEPPPSSGRKEKEKMRG